MRIVHASFEGPRCFFLEKLQVAETGFTRMKGLLGRSMLPTGEGLWIRPSSGIHTVGMQFPIDVVGLDKSLAVVKLWPNVRPFRVTSLSWKTQSVIELAAGEIQANDIQIGDRMLLHPVADQVKDQW